MKKIVLIIAFFAMLSFNSYSQERISFSEEEDIQVSDKFLKALQLDKLIIRAGEYNIDFNEENPFGIVVFNIKEFSGNVDIVNQKLAPGIRIAKRKHRSCPLSTCACGIGFRCGFTNLGDEGGNDGDAGGDIDFERIAYVTVTLDKEKNTISLSFVNKLNWEKLND